MPQHLDIVLTREDIQKKVARLAEDISRYYKDQEIIVVGVLKGAFIFLADLVRQLKTPVQIDFVRLASYGAETTSSGRVEIIKKLDMDIAGKHVLVVEDIIDSGLTIACLMDYLKQLRPASLKVCALIEKTERQEVKVPLDFVGHTVATGFLVGYGLDLNERYRSLPEIYHLRT
jgi:hypoxanthine phosphoribosyltransferase